MTRARCQLAVCLALTPSFVVGTAAAEPDAQAKAIASALFEQGRALIKAKRYAEACPKFAASEQIDPSEGTLLNLAWCYEQLGRTASAWTTYKELAETSKGPERVRQGREGVARVLPHLVHMTLTPTELNDAQLIVKLDGQTQQAATFGLPIPVDPGDHTVEVSEAGKTAWVKRISVAEGEDVAVQLPILEDLPPSPGPERDQATPAPKPQAVTSAAHAQPPPLPKKATWQKPTGLAVAGLGLVVTGVGGFFGIRAQQNWSSAEPQCPSRGCSQGGYDSWNDARADAKLATIFTTVGGAALVTGLVVWAIAPNSTASMQAGVGPGCIRAKWSF